MNKTVIITGAAGFIGSHTCEHLLERGWHVIGIDNFDSFYNREIKEKNLSDFSQHPRFKLLELDICDENEIMKIGSSIDAIIHLAAKAGVRPSIENPSLYQKVNVIGTQNMLEFAKVKNVKQFVFASSSSVYGINENVPWSEQDNVLLPISPYASSKIACELMGHVYHELYGIRFLGLRFFTVYGPRQRPDLAIHKFAKFIMNDQPLTLYGDGSTSRDYTFVDDIVQGIIAALDYDKSGYEIINLGNSDTITLLDLVKTIETVFDKKVKKEWLPNQQGDVPQTYADVDKAYKLLGYTPATKINEGIKKFRDWIENN